MIWVFGSVFLILVAFFAFFLMRKSLQIREALGAKSRSHRITGGAIGAILSFISAYFALVTATGMQDWNQPSAGRLLGVMLLMLGFVFMQVGAMLCFVSIVTDSETTDDSKRS